MDFYLIFMILLRKGAYIMRTVFARDFTASNILRSEPLYINNCGYYLGMQQDMRIERPAGRVDYHFIYVFRGVLSTNYGRIRSGECIFYKPGTAHCYEYPADESSVYLWVHYSGRDAEKMLGERESGIISCGKNSSQIYELFLRMTSAIQEGFYGAELYALGMLSAICALIANGERERSPFGSVISMMHDLSAEYSIADYAERAKMSKEHFIRSFKRYTEKTPVEYRTDIMISHAKLLLLETSLAVGLIAEMSGFKDALYFSRVFKRRVGVSPSEFRRTVSIAASDLALADPEAEKKQTPI